MGSLWDNKRNEKTTRVRLRAEAGFIRQEGYRMRTGSLLFFVGGFYKNR